MRFELEILEKEGMAWDRIFTLEGVLLFEINEQPYIAQFRRVEKAQKINVRLSLLGA